MKIQFGKVLSFNPVKGKGWLEISGQTLMRFSLDSQREFTEGKYQPEFGTAVPTGGRYPQAGEQLVLQAREEFEIDLRTTSSGRQNLKRSVTVIWGLSSDYDDARKRIAERPVYWVVEFILYNDKPVSVNQRKVIATGTAVELQDRYPRGALNARLTSENKFMGFTYRRRFYRREVDGRLTQCDDPRPLPVGAIAEPFRPVNEQGELLATPEELSALQSRISMRSCSRSGCGPRTMSQPLVRNSS